MEAFAKVKRVFKGKVFKLVFTDKNPCKLRQVIVRHPLYFYKKSAVPAEAYNNSIRNKKNSATIKKSKAMLFHNLKEIIFAKKKTTI